MWLSYSIHSSHSSYSDSQPEILTPIPRTYQPILILPLSLRARTWHNRPAPPPPPFSLGPVLTHNNYPEILTPIPEILTPANYHLAPSPWPLSPTGIPRSQENATPSDPAEGPCLSSSGDPRGWAVLYAQGTRVARIERLVFHCQTTSVSVAHATHCASYCTPCRPLTRAFSGWNRILPPNLYRPLARQDVAPPCSQEIAPALGPT